MNILRKFLSWIYTNARDFRRLDLRERMMRIHRTDTAFIKHYTLEETDSFENEFLYRDDTDTLITVPVKFRFIAYSAN